MAGQALASDQRRTTATSATNRTPASVHRPAVLRRSSTTARAQVLGGVLAHVQQQLVVQAEHHLAAALRPQPGADGGRPGLEQLGGRPLDDGVAREPSPRGRRRLVGTDGLGPGARCERVEVPHPHPSAPPRCARRGRPCRRCARTAGTASRSGRPAPCRAGRRRRCRTSARTSPRARRSSPPAARSPARRRRRRRGRRTRRRGRGRGRARSPPAHGVRPARGRRARAGGPARPPPRAAARAASSAGRRRRSSSRRRRRCPSRCPAAGRRRRGGGRASGSRRWWRSARPCATAAGRRRAGGCRPAAPAATTWCPAGRTRCGATAPSPAAGCAGRRGSRRARCRARRGRAPPGSGARRPRRSGGGRRPRRSAARPRRRSTGRPVAPSSTATRSAADSAYTPCRALPRAGTPRTSSSWSAGHLQGEGRPAPGPLRRAAPGAGRPVGPQVAVGPHRFVGEAVVVRRRSGGAPGGRVGPEQVELPRARRRGDLEPAHVAPHVGRLGAVPAVQHPVHGGEVPAASEPQAGVDAQQRAEDGRSRPPGPPRCRLGVEPGELRGRLAPAAPGRRCRRTRTSATDPPPSARATCSPVRSPSTTTRSPASLRPASGPGTRSRPGTRRGGWSAWPGRAPRRRRRAARTPVRWRAPRRPPARPPTAAPGGRWRRG